MQNNLQTQTMIAILRFLLPLAKKEIRKIMDGTTNIFVKDGKLHFDNGILDFNYNLKALLPAEIAQ